MLRGQRAYIQTCQAGRIGKCVQPGSAKARPYCFHFVFAEKLVKGYLSSHGARPFISVESKTNGALPWAKSWVHLQNSGGISSGRY